MKQLTPEQSELVSSLVERLGNISGSEAVVPGGPHARGRARAEPDIDLGLFYSEATPLSIQQLRERAEAVNDTANPVVTDFYGWGPWVNGGAWLTIGGVCDLQCRRRAARHRQADTLLIRFNAA